MEHTKNDFDGTWKEITTDIDFSIHAPISVSNSLHIHEERYEINGKKYRLLYAIGCKGDPYIEILV